MLCGLLFPHRDMLRFARRNFRGFSRIIWGVNLYIVIRSGEMARRTTTCCVVQYHQGLFDVGQINIAIRIRNTYA